MSTKIETQTDSQRNSIRSYSHAELIEAFHRVKLNSPTRIDNYGGRVWVWCWLNESFNERQTLFSLKSIEKDLVEKQDIRSEIVGRFIWKVFPESVLPMRLLVLENKAGYQLLAMDWEGLQTFKTEFDRFIRNNYDQTFEGMKDSVRPERRSVIIRDGIFSNKKVFAAELAVISKHNKRNFKSKGSVYFNDIP